MKKVLNLFIIFIFSFVLYPHLGINECHEEMAEVTHCHDDGHLLTSDYEDQSSEHFHHQHAQHCSMSCCHIVLGLASSFEVDESFTYTLQVVFVKIENNKLKYYHNELLRPPIV